MSRHLSPARGFEYTDSNPLSPHILEDLLQGGPEWINIQEIVKLSFKAMCDVFKRHQEAIHELERQVHSRCSKHELANALSLKANIADVSKTVAEVANNIECRAMESEVQRLVGDKVARSDLQYLLANKANIDEVKVMMEGLASQGELNHELHRMSVRLEDMRQEMQRRMAVCPSDRDLIQLKKAIEQKADLEDVQQSLNSKANKQSVANALHRKANRAQIDAILSTKAESNDVQRIQQTLDAKVDYSHFESLGKSLEERFNTSAHKSDIDMYVSAVQSQKLEFEERVARIERELNTLLSSFHKDIGMIQDEIAKGLGHKADSGDLDSVNLQMNKKVDYDHLNAMISQTKSDLFEQFAQFKADAALSRRKGEDQIIQKSRNSEKLAERAFEEARKAGEALRHINQERRADVDDLQRYMKTITETNKQELVLETNKMLADLERMKREIDELDSRKANARDLMDTKQKLIALFEPKVDLSQVQTALTTCQTNLTNRLADFKDDIKQQFRHLEDDLYKSLDKKADVQDVQNALSLKADASTIIQSSHAKANAADVEQLKLQIDRVGRELSTKAQARDFEGYLGQMRQTLEEMQKDLMMKANIKDVSTIIDKKASIDDVNKALIEVHKELDLKSSQQEVTASLNDQALINQALCAQNCVARWIWKSGEVKSGYAIPWQVQSVNTCPDNFLWQKEKTSILTVAPGLYEVIFGFFARKKPTVQLLVNGEPVLSAVNSASYVVHHSSGQIKNTGKHSAGNVTGKSLSELGLTLIDFIALPARARLSISYGGEPGAEGFLGLKKL